MLRYVFICLFSVLFWSSPVLAEDEVHEESSCGCHKTSAEIESGTEDIKEESSFPTYTFAKYIAAISSGIFAYKFYQTGRLDAALISGASLGLLFLCTCNGSIRFGLCPQRVSYYMSSAFAVFSGFAGLLYLREQNRLLD